MSTPEFPTRPSLAVTHSGDFHPDDVGSGALLREVFPGLVIIRTRDSQVLAEAVDNRSVVVFDVGGEFDVYRRNYDHHQRDGAPAPRANDVGYSSFGLLWRGVYGQTYCIQLVEEFGLQNEVDFTELHELIDEEFVQGIDVLDAGQVEDPNFRPMVGEVPVEVMSFGQALFELVPQPLLYETPDYDGAYEEAVVMVQKFLRRFAEARLAKLIGRKFLDPGRRIEEKIVVSSTVVPGWSGVVSTFYKETLYYIDPDPSDPAGQACRLWQVPTTPGAFSGRKPLPEAWAGLREADLEAVTGIPGANFCHTGRFVGGGKTLEATLAMARAAIAAK